MSDNERLTGNEPTDDHAVAALPSAEDARRAAEELRRSGFLEDRLSVSAEAVRGRPEAERRERDAEIGRRARTATWVWGAVGAVAGAILGVVAATASSDTGSTGIVVFGVAGAIAIGAAASLVAGIGSLQDERPSEAPVVTEKGRRSVVGVEVGSREELDRAVAVLRRSGASAIEVFDRAGNRVHAA